jgi:N-acetylglucosaminyldiphosphoundecaprenol N-acetyl-beta-D-mannosaminyltransferase
MCNAYTLSLVRRDAHLRDSLQRADLNFADGVPVAWFGRRKGAARPVRGPDLMRDVVIAGAKDGVRHYLYGGALGVGAEVAAALVGMVDGVSIAGVEAPPYHDLTNSELHALALRVRNAQASIVWIGLGTPRQDYLVPQLAARVKCVVIPVGAAFDFISGRIAEAPALLQASGVEWMYRLHQDPKRLWRRYLVGNPRFAMHAMRRR